MKKLRGSFGAKLVAVLLLCLFAAGLALSLLGIYANSQWGSYDYGYEQARDQVIGGTGHDYLYRIGEDYLAGRDVGRIYRDSRIRFTILDGEGNELFSNYEGEEPIWQGEITREPDVDVYEYGRRDETVTPTPAPTMAVVTPFPVETDADGNALVPSTPEPVPEPVLRVTDRRSGESAELSDYEQLEQWIKARSLTVRGCILPEGTAGDGLSRSLTLFETCYRLRYAMIGAALVCLPACVLLFVFLLWAAGHRDETDTVTAGPLDRIPFEPVLAAAGLLFCLGLTPIFELGMNNLAEWVIAGMVLLAQGLLVLWTCMSLAVRIKLGTLWKESLCGRLLRRLGKLWRALRQGAGALIRAMPMLWRWVLALAAAVLLELLVLLASGGYGGILWVLQNLIGIPLILYALLAFRRLRLGAREIAQGNYACSVDTRYLRGELLEHANDLNHIRQGMNRAVDERLKSERFRTELITNVSHDIKTPLTSIVNYVDLLAKEEPENEKMRDYIQVLSRQSARLRKLIDDLIEASKASTGSLPVNPERIELNVLLDQCAGEYGEKLSAAGLELLVSKPEESVCILADGRHMWRIFDNLLSNVVKYAQPGTRVYLDLEQAAGKAVVTVRNISRNRLNVSGEELMERFVRGDSARSTEGSGLGLSIASSLTRLQQGEMDLSVDGDLFKVTLRFDTE